MAIRRRTAVLTLILTLSALGLYYAVHAPVKPEAARSALSPHYMGQAVLALPHGFKVKSGRLSVACPGRPGLTSVMETPHQSYGPVAFEALSIMLPRGSSQIVRDLSRDFGRPAQLVHTDLGSNVILSSVIADFERGSLRLSRTGRAGEGAGADDDFVREALDFMGNYTWGHQGAKSGDLHSLYGRLGRGQPCRRAGFNLLFASEDGAVKLFLNTDDDLAAGARAMGLEPAAEGSPARPPSWFSEAVKIFQGQWNRKIQGGPRRVAGRPGLEWVAIRRDLSSGRVFFAAQWLPEAAPGQSPMPALLMNADLSGAPSALRLWNDILNSSTLAMDFYL